MWFFSPKYLENSLPFVANNWKYNIYFCNRQAQLSGAATTQSSSQGSEHQDNSISEQKVGFNETGK